MSGSLEAAAGECEGRDVAVGSAWAGAVRPGDGKFSDEKGRGGQQRVCGPISRPHSAWARGSSLGRSMGDVQYDSGLVTRPAGGQFGFITVSCEWPWEALESIGLPGKVTLD